MNEFFTWELLATYTGACLGTGVVTELLKGLFPAAPGRLLGYLTAAALLLLAQGFTGGLTLSGGVLALLNAALVALAAGSGYDLARGLTGKK